MSAELQHRAEAIKAAIRQQPAQGADLLIDFALRYAVNPDWEDEAIIKKHEWISTDQDADLEAGEKENKKQVVKQALLQLTDRIAAAYNPESVKALLEKERRLTAAVVVKPPNDLVLVAKNLVKTYTGNRFRLQVDHLELRLGEITGLVGENATGKSTLFRILAGEQAPQSGSVHYPLFDPGNRLHWPDLRGKIAYVPQELPLWLGSLQENLQYEAALHGIRGAENVQAVDFIIQRLGLANYMDKTWSELSGGYKLRFALAKALVWKAQLLLVDEPLAFLDIKTQIIVLNDLKNLAKNLRHPISILISSQHLHEIEAVADQMLFMDNGTLEHLGRMDEFGKNRLYNVFEIGSALPFPEFENRISGLDVHKVWSNGLVYLVSTPLGIDTQIILKFMLEQQIPVNHFRDISCSVKTRFYADRI